MGKIDTSEWKEFRIGDYFKVEYGRFHVKDELGTGTVNYITTSGFNNGITNTCEEATHQGNCITVASDGAMGASFYQEEAFTTSNIVSTLTPLPHTPLNKYNALFLCAIIFGKRAEFGWLGFKMSVDRVRNLRVKLPTTPDGDPDWAYMESYIANLETQVAESLTLLQAAKNAEKKKVDAREWGKFRVGELFDAALSKDDIQPKVIVEGNTPLVSSGKENNGIIALIDNKNARLWEANTLTVDMFGKVFYQEQPYYAVSHGRVNILMPRMPNRNDEIRNQYQEGISAEELAKAFNLNRATIFRILKEGGDSYHRHLDTKIETSTLRRIKDFKQGFVDYAKKNPNTPVENLAREYGISPSSGFKYLHEAGIYRGKGRKKKAAKPKG